LAKSHKNSIHGRTQYYNIVEPSKSFEDDRSKVHVWVFTMGHGRLLLSNRKIFFELSKSNSLKFFKPFVEIKVITMVIKNANNAGSSCSAT